MMSEQYINKKDMGGFLLLAKYRGDKNFIKKVVYIFATIIGLFFLKIILKHSKSSQTTEPTPLRKGPWDNS